MNAELVPLSLQLDFLRMMDNGSQAGPYGPRYTIVAGWRVAGNLHEETLKDALYDVVRRHEALRTRVLLDGTEACQEICPAVAPGLEVREIGAATRGDREIAAEEFLNEVEAGVSVPNEVPRLRAVLGRFDSEDSVLALVAHHTMVDGLSAHVLLRDLAAIYTARRSGRQPTLPPARQYREYVAWQREWVEGPEVAAARAFWREKLRGARLLPVPNDWPRSAVPYTTGWYRFMLEEEFRAATLRAAKKYKGSPFMVLMAAFMTMLRNLTGETDLVVPTLTTGRMPEWTRDMVGTFYNFMPLRTDISGYTNFGEVVAAVRAACLASYPHELPFPLVMAEAPELMTEVVQPGAAAAAFQVIQHGVATAEHGDEPQFTAIRRRVVSTETGSQIPDGILAELDLHPQGGMFGKVAYTRHMYDVQTIVAMMAELRQVLEKEIVSGADS